MKIRTDPDGSLHIEADGEAGRVFVDTTGPTKRVTLLPPDDAEVLGPSENVLLHFCDGCKSWMELRDGKPVHSDDQIVKCVLES